MVLDTLRGILANALSTTPPTPLQRRRSIAEDTISRSQSIILQHKHAGATVESSFLSLDQLQKLEPLLCPNFPPSAIKVVNSDSFTTARGISGGAGAISVLNLASDEYPGGGWVTSLSVTQEEALCYSSTLYATLNPEYYPWPNTGPGSAAGFFSPGVVIFKDDLDHDCAELQPRERRIVSVITIAAPRRRRLTADGTTFRDSSTLEDLRGKIRLIYRMAAHNGQTHLVLGAMGCGAYGCPPDLVAAEMKSILLGEEFTGWFREVIFAVYSKGGIGEGNFGAFSRAFSDVQVNKTIPHIPSSRS